MRWDKSFDTRSLNPNNHKMIVAKAIDIKIMIEHEGYGITGANGKVKKGNVWMVNPKIWVTDSTGKNAVSLKMPKNPKDCKSLIAILYSLSHLSGVTKISKVFYKDNKGLATSIATKHGPMKSEYMKKLISVLEDKQFIQSLNEQRSRPLPDDLSKLHIDLISECKEGVLPSISVERLMNKHSLDCKEFEAARVELLANSDVDNHRVPGKIIWPKITLPNHFDEVEDRISSAINSANAEIGNIKAELETTKSELIHTIDYNERLMKRNLWSRIINKDEI
jgi:hypothetical protein